MFRFITTMISKVVAKISSWLKQIIGCKLILNLYLKLHLFIMNIWNKPDFSEAIIFNELPFSCPGKHRSKNNCSKKYCEVCRIDAVIKYLHTAKYSLDIAQLTFSSQHMFDALLEAKARGVAIRMVTDCEMIFVRGSVYFDLHSKGIPIRIARKGMMMHHKFCIIDGDCRIMELNKENGWNYSLWKRKDYVMTGSLNWTRQGIYGNFENVVVTSNKRVISSYQQIFNHMWSKFEDIGSKNRPRFPVKWF